MGLGETRRPTMEPEIIINTKAPYLPNQDTRLVPLQPLSYLPASTKTRQPDSDHHVAEPARRLGLL